ncbi:MULTISPECIES: trehalose-phosphatase [Micromonospora]|uniref:Trehalose 6-phosphate phosphatase n=1 Tax=Micromonospora solifontis TaxID=2487138 RepID=A0ABX9WP65_9ACTN|nr:MULTISPECIES: trehalose-phosphatase [Micromonospora]NES14338.1 trehalose-phosphatase [Micromonospora sp. PPF5-17B]NES35054.1 trehalose-phosphatase [Micromonospora solifontis]NES57765.1 trehalose-phosphatase [Micromonospora sp. PPF5-6]RNM01324.1 trehalose-phosphatase [Micromonospora solifontis]
MPPLNLGNQPPKTPLDAEHAWRATAARAADVVFFFDFDGTLAPVDDDPTAVQPAPKVLAALEALAPRVRRIAIVSARPVEFLRDHLGGLAGIDLYGLYGLEHSHSGGETVTEPAALPWVPTMAELAEQARAELPPGALVEFKRLSVALHWRTAPQLGELVQEWGRQRAERLGLRCQAGRMVLELKPPVDRDKGMVIGEAVRDACGAWYFGDDVSDIKAFAALRARAAADPDFVGVCVAVANPETGHEVADAADLTLDSPAALADFLTQALPHLP